MSRRVLVDTGPIVALLNRRDEYHEWARETFDALEPPLHTCEPVLAEATHLVRRLRGGREAVIDLVIRGVLHLDFSIADDLLPLRALLERYASVPMSLADACLVRMTERVDGEVMTVDTDFRIYRRAGRRVIRLIAPSAT